jgi:hypothetical protein
MKSADFDYVRNYVRTQAAIVIEPGKEYLVESRLTTLARKEKIASIDLLVEQLRAKPGSDLHRRVVDAMTTNETSFFRTPANFEWLKARPKIGGSFIGAGFVLKSKPQAGQEEDVLFLSIDAHFFIHFYLYHLQLQSLRPL